MRVESVNPIVQAALDVLKEALGTDITRGRLNRYAKALGLHRISAIVGVNGSVEGTMLFSMPLNVALAIAAVITDEQITVLDDITQAAIIGLADTIASEAVRCLNKSNRNVSVTPAVLIWGQGMQLSCAEAEAVSIPLQMPLGTVELTIALREPGDSDH